MLTSPDTPSEGCEKLSRETLATRPNPNRETDYVVLLGGCVRPRGFAAPLNLRLHYVPDRLIASTEGWRRYLEALSADDLETIEALAGQVLSDINNEIVPRWLSVTVSDSGGGPAHAVVIEDRQPKWDNPDLLDRIPGIGGAKR